MNIAEKVALANTLAAYLDGTCIAIADELRDRAATTLVGDDEFDRLFSERCWLCPDCGVWTANSGGWAEGHPPCADCAEDEDWWDE